MHYRSPPPIAALYALAIALAGPAAVLVGIAVWFTFH